MQASYEKTASPAQELNDLQRKAMMIEKKLEAAVEEKLKLLQENIHLEKSISDLKYNIVGLEGTRDQLEGERYRLQVDVDKKEKDLAMVRLEGVFVNFLYSFVVVVVWVQISAKYTELETKVDKLKEEALSSKCTLKNKDKVIAELECEIKYYKAAWLNTYRLKISWWIIPAKVKQQNSMRGKINYRK